MTGSALLTIFAIFGSLHLVLGQQCPYKWYGYSPTSKCYRFVYTTKLGWQDARNFCQLHGGDLLRFDSVNERKWVLDQVRNIAAHNTNWVLGQVRNIAAHNKQVTSTNWWTGLNNKEYLQTWAWPDGSPAKYINWKPGEPNNAGNDERCGEINNGVNFNDETCTENDYFICSRDRGLPLLCDADRGWQTLNGQCVKVYTTRKSWNAAQRQCSHDGAAMATVANAVVQQTLHDFAVSAKTSLWIGVHSLKTGATTNSWILANGTALTTTPFWRANKPPTINRQQLNSTCVAISNTATSQQSWNPSVCSSPRAFVCQKPQGTCFPGWIGHRNYCYQFDALYRLSFTAATRYCQNQGTELMRVASGSDQYFLTSYLGELRDSGVNNFWIGLSDNNVDAGPYKWRNGQTVATALKVNWAAAHHTPANTKGRQDCAYISTTDTAGKWRTTSNCASTRAFVCRLPMGRSLKAQPSTPRPHYGCPSGWQLHIDTCYKLYDGSVNAQRARAQCQRTTGADLAKIVNADMQGFVNGLIKNKGLAYYIGLNDKTTDGVYEWNDETAPTAYTNWARGQPNDPSHVKNCVILRRSQWTMVPCSENHLFICSLLANSALAPISTTPKVDWTVKCGPGWESNPVTASCYQFVDSPLAWPDARLQCRVAGGDLVSIETVTEQNYLAGRLRSMSSIVVWTGANDRQTEGGWSWASGAAFAFLNWAPGQPGGSKGQGTDCVAMLTSTAMWDDVACNARNGFVCEKQGNVPTTQPPTVKPTTVPAGRVLGCYTGWLPFNGSCYRVTLVPSSWARASMQCSAVGSHLASILGSAEQNFILANLPKTNDSLAGLWIGLNDQRVDMNFEWTDRSPVTYTNWNVNEPNNWMNRNEDCTEIKLQSGKWNDGVCSTVKQGYICKRPKSFVSATQRPYQVNCRTYDRGYGPYCYSLSTGPVTWSAANARCKTRFNGTLATVNDRFHEAFLSSWLTTRFGFFWLGINDNAKSGAWADGSQIQYTNWDRNHTGSEVGASCIAMKGVLSRLIVVYRNTLPTGNEVGASCVAMKARPLPAGFWENVPCGRAVGYMCQYQRTGYTFPPTTTLYPNVPCPQGWAANGGFCYKAYAPNPAINWMEASTYCQTMGGNLASFHAKNNDSFLYPLVQNMSAGNFFIGINDRSSEGGFKWSDGSAVDYTNWNPTEPNNYHGFEDCGVYVKYSKGWNDLNCYTPSPFICMIPRGQTLLTTPVAPTAVTSSICGPGSNWVLYNSSCYMTGPASGPNSSLSWYDAAAYCQGNQAALASFHGFDEIQAVLGATAKQTRFYLWIGLNMLGGDAYRWADGTPLDYTRWNANQPDDYGGVERCAEMSKMTGRWNDDQCNMKRGFICRKPSYGHITAVTPAPYPAGGCQNGFTRVPGGRNKCFYIGGGGMPTTQRNFNDAVRFCRSFGPGYDIASIEDIFEQEFLITMTYGNRASIWIGMSDTRGNNKFFWNDNVPVSYTNWDKNEPTSSQTSLGAGVTSKQNCVVMRMYKNHEGRWADLDCSVKRAFVCQSRQIPTAPIIQPPSNCLKGYVPFRQACYKFSHAKLPWNDAASDCGNDGGTLASVLDVFEKAFILYQAYNNTPYWIGLSDQYTPGLYGWNDGYPVSYTNWGWGEPSYDQLGSGQNNHGCVYVNKNGRWNDSDCSLILKYACKITTATPPPTPPPTYGNCSQPGAIASGDTCYLVFVNEGRSWPEANFRCTRLGMQLASVHSEGEMQFLTILTSQAKVTNPKYKPNVWIGMSKGPQGAYQWTDGSAVDYLSWAPGEPSTLGQGGNQQECIEYDRLTGSWNDVGCMSNRAYVCKALKPTATTTPMPGSFQPINPGGRTSGPGQPPINPPTYPPLGVLTDSTNTRPGQGVSQLPGLTKPGGVPVIYPVGANSSPQKSTAGVLGLSGGGIAGVVIACLVILVVAALFVLYLKRSGKIKTPNFEKNEQSLGFDNALYDRERDAVKIDSDD